MIAARAAWRTLGRRAVIAGVGAELRRVAEDRLELGGDRRVIGASENRRGEHRARGGCEQLHEKRKRNHEGG